MNINVTKNDFIWSYLGHFFNLGTNIILLPVILRILTPEEIGIWYTFASVYALVILIDFGFSTNLIRNLTYAWSGAKKLISEGMPNIPDDSFVNKHMFAVVFQTTRKICLIISLIVLFVMATLGTIYIYNISMEMMILPVLIAWGIYISGSWANIYFNYYVLGLKSVGYIAGSQQAVVGAKIIQLIISVTGLLLGGGLIAVSAAYFLSGIVMRYIAKVKLYKYSNIGSLLRDEIHFISKNEIKDTMKIIWKNAKKAGIVTIFSTIYAQSGMLVCSAYIGVAEAAVYGLSLQLLAVISGVGQIFYQTNIASLTNARLNNDLSKEQKIFSTAIVLLWVCVIGGSIFLVFFGNVLLVFINSNVTLILSILIIVSVYKLLEDNFALSMHFISMRNTYPFVKTCIVTAFAQIAGYTALILFGRLTLISIVMVNLFSRFIFLAWKWPIVCLKELKLNYFQLACIGVNNIFCLLKVKKGTF